METLFEKLSSLIKTVIPGFENKWKGDSTLNKLAAWFVKPFNPDYFTSYITTLYPKVYWPTKNFGYDHDMNVLSHEYLHLFDTKRLGLFTFALLYPAPQIFAILSLLSIFAIWNLWFLLCLSFLLCLLPIPAPFRMWAEMRGYTMSMAMFVWQYGDIDQGNVDFFKSQFTGWQYYKMWPLKKDLDKRFDKALNDIKTLDILEGKNNEPFRMVFDFLKKENLLHPTFIR